MIAIAPEIQAIADTRAAILRGPTAVLLVVLAIAGHIRRERIPVTFAEATPEIEARIIARHLAASNFPATTTVVSTEVQCSRCHHQYAGLIHDAC